MGRLKTLLKWEFSDVIRNILFLSGIVFVGMLMKNALMYVNYTVGSGSGENLSLVWRATHAEAVILQVSISGALSQNDLWTMMGFIILLLGALAFRYDRDSGVARSVYSLPYSNTEIFGVRLLSLVTYGFLMVLLPFVYVITTTYTTILHYLPAELSGFIVSALVLVIFFVLYLTAVATVVSIVFPNAFLAFMVGFTILYVPKILGIGSIPPAVFIRGLDVCSSTGFTPFTLHYLMWGLAVPLLLLGVSLVLINRRDVV